MVEVLDEWLATGVDEVRAVAGAGVGDAVAFSSKYP